MKTLRTMVLASLLAVFLLLAVTLGAAAAQGQADDASISPSNLTATPGTERWGAVLWLEWEAPSNENYNKHHRVWYWETGDKSTVSSGFVSSGLTKIFFFNSWLEAGKTYSFQVESLETDENGNQVLDENRYQRTGGRSNIVSYTAAASPDASNLTAVQSGAQVVLTWIPGNHPNIAEQHIKRREPRKGWTTIKVGADDATYTDSSVSAGTRYIYRIESWSADGSKLGVSRPAKVKVE